jgi:hypothetical protein
MKDRTPLFDSRLDWFYFYASKAAGRCLACGVEWQECISWPAGFWDHCRAHAKRDAKDAHTP